MKPSAKRLISLILFASLILSLSACATKEASVVITKNPSSEALVIGGKTWFIAHANNANSLTWCILSTECEVYSLDETMQKHHGLKLETLEGDTIAVSNVPIRLNG